MAHLANKANISFCCTRNDSIKRSFFVNIFRYQWISYEILCHMFQCTALHRSSSSDVELDRMECIWQPQDRCSEEFYFPFSGKNVKTHKHLREDDKWLVKFWTTSNRWSLSPNTICGGGGWEQKKIVIYFIFRYLVHANWNK